MRANVRLRTPLPAFLLALLLAAGCGGEAPMDEPGAVSTEGFGAPYEILLGETPASPDVPPHLEGDTLVVLVGFSGGCEDHEFHLEHEVEADTARFRLRHESGGDDCEAWLTEPLRLPVPSEALDAPHRVLLHPEGKRPYLLTGQ